MAVPTARQSQMNFRELRRVLEESRSNKDVYQAIVDKPFSQTVAAAELFLGFMCVFIGNPKKKQVKLMSSSDNDFYHQSIQGYNFDSKNYHLSYLSDSDNDIVKAILTGKPQFSDDWKSYTRRTSDPEQARLNQANGGIAVNAVYPLDIENGGALLFCFFNYQDSLGSAQKQFMKKYSHLVGEVLQAKA